MIDYILQIPSISDQTSKRTFSFWNGLRCIWPSFCINWWLMVAQECLPDYHNKLKAFFEETHPFRWGSGTSVDLAEKRLGFTVILEGTPNFRPRFAGDQVQLFSSGISDGRKWDISSKAVVTLMSGTERTGHGQLGRCLSQCTQDSAMNFRQRIPSSLAFWCTGWRLKLEEALMKSNYN